MKLHELTIEAAHEKLKSGEISARNLTEAVLERIAAVDETVGAYLTVDEEGALAQADAADKRIAKDDIGPLTGVPIAVKDLICTEGLRTTCASKILENFIPPYDAAVVETLRKAGAVIVGKTNMDEFAMGSSNENSGLRLTRNPWKTDRVPGGSSGGSAAAVAGDMCMAALGSDTGGSIRQPASHCGVVGLKPTYGRVSRYGLVAYASSLDQIGPITKSVADAAMLLNALAGHDGRDSTSVAETVPDYTASLDGDVKGLKIGLPKEYFEIEGLHPEVDAAIKNAITRFEALGAETVTVSLPMVEYVVAAYYVIATSEASSNLARYDGVKYGYRAPDAENLIEMYRNTRSQGFGPEVQRRIILGTYSLSAGYYDAYYGKASQVRTLIIEDFRKAFTRCDVILSPVAPTPAFAIGEKVDDPLTMYLTDIYTLSANMAGICGISVPCAISSDGLPIGAQLMGGHFQEPTLLKAAYALERAMIVEPRRPAL